MNDAAGSNGAVFNTTALQNGDQVGCVLIVDPAFIECSTIPSVTSSSITASIINRPAPTISISEELAHWNQRGQLLSISLR